MAQIYVKMKPYMRMSNLRQDMSNTRRIVEKQALKFAFKLKRAIMKQLKTMALGLLLGGSVWAQVGINTTSPNAVLDVRSSNQSTPNNNDGLLIPKVDEFPVLNPTIAQDGMLVFVTGAGTPTKGFYYWNQGSTSWVPMSVGNATAAWYNANTTTNASTTTANIFRTGNIGIGTTNPIYPLEITTTSNTDAVVSSLTNTVDNLSVRNANFSTTSSADNVNLTGIRNNVSGTGTVSVQNITGMTNFMSNASSGGQVGLENSMTAAGNGDVTGIQNLLNSIGSGSVYGIKNTFQVGNGNQYGVHTSFTPNAASSANLFGTYVTIGATATSGNSYGIYADVQGINAYAGYFLGNVTIGTTTANTYTLPASRGTNGQVMQTDGSGNVSWATPSALSDTSPAWYDESTTTAATTTNSDIIRTGNVGLGVSTADYSLEIFDNRGTTSLYIGMDDTSAPTNTPSYGIQTLIDNDNNGLSIGDSYAIENTLNVLADNGYGIRNNITGHLGGASTVYGAYNSINNDGIGDAYGTYNNVSGVSGNNYGSYNVVLGSGVGVYSSASGGADAGYFLGNVSIGTTTLNTYTFPPNRGANGQIMQTDGSGNVSWVNPSLGVEKIDDLTDGKSDNDGTNNGSSIYLGINSGTVDDASDNQNVGIGYGSMAANTSGSYNTVIGYQSLASGTTGFSNTGVGYQTLYNTTTGSFNTAMGDWSMVNNITGSHNVGIGYSALRFNTLGSSNTALGSSALWANLLGNNNTAIGKSALETNSTGDFNTGLGVEAAFNNINGSHITAIGRRALYTNTSANYLVAVGNDALFSNTTGFSNVAVGYSAGFSNTVGGENVSVGNSSFYTNTNGTGNVAVGYQALYGTSHTGSSNVAIGRNSMYSNGAGSYNISIGDGALYNANASYNIAIGYRSLYGATNGSRNTATGHESLFSNTSGSYNTALGYYSLRANTIGVHNVAVGYLALDNNTNGYYNTALGSEALSSNGSSDHNTAIGHQSLWISTGALNTGVGSGTLIQNTSGFRNNAMGYYAMSNNSTGYRNTAIGCQSLDNNTTGSYNTALGNFAFSSGTSYTNSTALGYNAQPNASNTVRVGDASVTTIGGFANWTNVSDARFKTQVQENVVGLEFVMKLRPVTYRLDMNAITSFYKTPEEQRIYESEKLKEAETQIGFLAQEVEKAAALLQFDFHGVDCPENENDHYGLRYAEFVPVLVKAIQEQQKEIETLKQELAKLKDLEDRLNKLEQRQ